MQLSTFEIHHLARNHPEELVRVVRDEPLTPPVLAYALEEMGAGNSGVATVALLWKSLLDPIAEVRRGAIRGLAALYGRTHDPAALVCVDKLRELGLTDPSKAVRDEATAALVALSPPTADNGGAAEEATVSA